ncbi:methyltransferase domain-containing protein [Clostridiaceae bacterium]|nr:methyltransferase domain-containing protein [Lachnospiraceae bacterium]NBH19039.1 methyltransferase domain-containing protein [Clostridiaceae bacterium]
MSCCIVCKNEISGKPLFVLENAPSSAQNIPEAGELGQDTGIDLHLYQCQNCGLVQFDCEPVSYYRDVIRSGGYSTTMVELRTRQYKHLIETYGLEGKKFLEVGCGQGEFLKVLTEFPVKAYGVEHREQLVELALKNGLNVASGFTENPDTVLGSAGPYDVFLSFNFLEHQPKPGIMLDCIWKNLVRGGMGLITVPSLEYVLQYNGYYELIRDHIAYYTFDTLRSLLEQHGFEVVEQEVVNRDTLSVIVKKTSKIKKNSLSAMPFSVNLSGLEDSFHSIRKQMKELTKDLEKQGQTLAVWGASHQGFTLASTTCLGEKACYIMDSAPFKQGRFAPASHLPIVAPDYFLEHPTDGILILAPGYTEEIAGIIRRRFGDKIRIFTLRSEKLEELI